MKNTKQIKQNLKKYYVGQISRTDITTLARNALAQDLEFRRTVV